VSLGIDRVTELLLGGIRLKYGETAMYQIEEVERMCSKCKLKRLAKAGPR
jgi:hypothetical protein